MLIRSFVIKDRIIKYISKKVRGLTFSYYLSKILAVVYLDLFGQKPQNS